VKGALNVEHLNPFIKVPFAAAGGVYLDGKIRLEDGLLDANGDVTMDDLIFEAPGYMKKEKEPRARHM